MKFRRDIIKCVIASEEREKQSYFSFHARNDVFLRLIFSLFLFLSFSSFAQTNKKKVLVVPYGRFEFVSKFSFVPFGIYRILFGILLLIIFN